MTSTTALDLDAIETRANAATPGPWGFYDGDNYADVAADLQQTSPGSYSYREKIARLEDENYWDDLAHEDDDEDRAPEQMAANAAFIAHAREDVPALLAEIRRLRQALTATRTKTLIEEADAIVQHCPDHGPQDQNGVWMDCHCAVADDIRRRTAA